MEYDPYWAPHSNYYHPCPYVMQHSYYYPHSFRQSAQPVWRETNEVPYDINQGPEPVNQARFEREPYIDPQVQSKMVQQFLNEDGQVDIQKMLQTVGQFADTVQQVSPVIKQLNDLVRSFRTP